MVDLLQGSLLLSPAEIRCSSLSGYGFPQGSLLDGQIKAELTSCAIVLGVITPRTRESDYVMFELGARWGMDKPYVCVLVSGGAELLPAPLRGIVACQTNRGELLTLVETVANHIGRQPQTPASWNGKLDRVFVAAENLDT